MTDSAVSVVQQGARAHFVNTSPWAGGVCGDRLGLGALKLPDHHRSPSRQGAYDMSWLYLLSYFFGGAFLANAAPHLVSGMMGRPFQSPFAKPPGKGLSSSTVNVLWGFFNLVVGYFLICRVGDFDLRHASNVVALGLGLFLLAVTSARLFGRVNGGNAPNRS
jgi:hypothetical protein